MFQGHALRLAGAHHVAQTLELRDAAPERIFFRQVELATQIVDQLHAVTAQFHDQQETDSMLLMRHIHEQGFRPMDARGNGPSSREPGLFEPWDQRCLLRLFKSWSLLATG